jgi:aspartate/methionine/tyrosine aminotransferase
LQTDDPQITHLLQQWIKDDLPLDKRFAYYLLATTGVCVVPLSSFHSNLLGFRVTLLEEDPQLLGEIFNKIKSGILNYCSSV